MYITAVRFQSLTVHISIDKIYSRASNKDDTVLKASRLNNSETASACVHVYSRSDDMIDYSITL